MSGPNDEAIIAAIADQLDMTPEEADAVLQAMIAVITEALTNDRSVILKGFGTFEVIKVRGEFGHRTRARRKRMIMQSSTRQPNFRAGSNLRRAVDDPPPSPNGAPHPPD